MEPMAGSSAQPMRPSNEALCEEDIFAHFKHRAVSSDRATIKCGYCGKRNRDLLIDQVAWFQTHSCRVDELQERRNLRILDELHAWTTAAA